MSIDLIESYRLRKSFSKIPSVLAIPHLLGVQIKSYNDFLQADVKPEERRDIGLHRAFKMVFPIEDYNGKASLEYVNYRFDKPKYEPGECRLKGYTYVEPLYVTFRLVIWEASESGGERTIRDVKEQEVYFGEIPIMTSNGAFIVNGTERAIVNQLHRSPGVFFDQVKSKEQSMGRVSYSARIVPQDGRWLDFEFDSKDLFQVRIDRKKRFLVTVLLKALGF
ncbi:MAG TPA: DNA-directed RNA polymerase subunit beta, partial [Thermodesulfobacteriota bacterium]